MNLFQDALSEALCRSEEGRDRPMEGKAMFTAHEQDDQEQAEMSAERELQVENALKYVYLRMMTYYSFDRRVLHILCRECGIPYERIVGK